MLGVDVVLVQEGDQLFPLRLGQPDAERTERIENDLAEDEVGSLRAGDLFSRGEHLLPEQGLANESSA
jgi:hypothetical protein